MTERHRGWIDAYRAGLSVAQIAREAKVTKQAVSLVLASLDEETRTLIDARREIEKAIVLRMNQE